MNDKTDAAIPEETRQRVIQAVRELGYVRNAAGRRLGSGKSHTLGFVLPSPEHVRTDAFVPQFLFSFNEICHQHHFNLLVHAVGSPARPDAYGDLVAANEIDGLFIVNPREDDRQIDALLDSGFPVVADPVRNHPRACGVGIDNSEAARMAVRHLVSLGHRRIACVNYGPSRFLSVAARCEGYRQALAEAGIGYEESLVTWADFSHESGQAAASELLDRGGERPTAVFAGNDTVAIGILAALKEHGLRVPQDVAVASIDDIPAARFMNPSLTTVRVPANDFGRLAGEMLIKLVYGEWPEPPHVILPTELIVRESSGRRSG